MPNSTILPTLRRFGLLAAVAPMFFLAPRFTLAQTTAKTQLVAPKRGGEASLAADTQRWAGKIYYGDGNVDVIYENARLHADHVEYNSETEVAMARGHVALDYMTQHVEADDARYELRTGKGTFHHVRATFAMQRRPAPTLFISPNPLYFEADETERLDDNTYHLRKAWMTVCDPNHPTWKFYAPEATVTLRKSVRLENGNFRLYSIPVLYFPYATFPAEKGRNSGFMIPDPGHTSQKGYVLGDAFYWAPLDWMDLSLGGSYYSLRGWSQRGELRMRPWENARLEASYFGVIDRGLEESDGPPLKQGGHEVKLLFTADLPGGWRAVADLDQLTSLTFRLAWFETFSQAVNSEVKNTAFLTKNFDGYSLDFAVHSYENFLSATPESSVTLRAAPEARFSSVDRPLLERLPLYFSFDAFTGGVHRSETVTPFTTPGFVGRSEIAPTVTMPFHLGAVLDVTPSFTFRSTYYGGQMQEAAFLNQGIFRNTAELSVDFRLATIERVWGRGDTKWKHTIEPSFEYNYVNGVNHFANLIRFDEDETLTDTNEVEYGITQRLFRRNGTGDAQELVTWKIAQKYYFDPTFGGALINGQRNVFQALDSITPFAFADGPRRFSPIVSELTIEPGKHYDTEFILNYDTQRNRMNAIGTLLKVKPYKESFLTVAQFSTLNLPLSAAPASPPGTCINIPGEPGICFQQKSNQVRAIGGYGDMNRHGWNLTFGASYDFTAVEFQNQIAEIGYNGSCCGFGFEYRKFSFGSIRNENQYMGVFRIANLGSLGNLRRQEKIF